MTQELARSSIRSSSNRKSIEPLDLDEAHRQRLRELEGRRRPLHAELPAEQARLAPELDAIQRTEPAAA